MYSILLRLLKVRSGSFAVALDPYDLAKKEGTETDVYACNMSLQFYTNS